MFHAKPNKQKEYDAENRQTIAKKLYFNVDISLNQVGLDSYKLHIIRICFCSFFIKSSLSGDGRKLIQVNIFIFCLF